MSHLEEQFAGLWLRAWPTIDLHSEWQFHSVRKWRFDFAHLPTKTAIEINGGLWVKSGHTTGQGIQRDYDKNNAAILEGWAVFQLCAATIDELHIMAIGRYINSMAEACQNVD